MQVGVNPPSMLRHAGGPVTLPKPPTGWKWRDNLGSTDSHKFYYLGHDTSRGYWLCREGREGFEPGVWFGPMNPKADEHYWCPTVEEALAALFARARMRLDEKRE